MKITVEVEMNNAAFSESEGGQGASGSEVARILHGLAERVDESDLADRDSGFLMDYNGNRVGSWAVTS